MANQMLNPTPNPYYKLQCTKCGKDLSGLNSEEYQTHQHIHIKEDIANKYPEFHTMVLKIEKEYGITLRIDFDD